MTDPSQDPPASAESFFRREEGSTRPTEVAAGAVKGAYAPGRTIGEYQLVRRLGRGGMGEVWEAEQSSLGRRVALKLMLAGRVSEKSVDYFSREARAGGRVQHPGIVSVYGTGSDEGVHWIAMELVEGGATLADFVEEMRAESELPADYYPRVAEFIARVSDALEAAHAEGVIHRDIKPANVLVGPDDEPKVGDFGLARVVDEHSLSQTGDFAGTYYYMSPEQVMARRMGIDQRTDVFSLGVVLYELLALQRPFEGDTTHQIAEKIAYEDPADIRKLRNRSLYENLDVLIVDEISMVRADLLDGVERFLRMNGPHRSRPFGGVRMICVGDLFQLAPVVRDAERPFFEAHYNSEWFFDANCLRDAVMQHVELEQVHRQEDAEDLALLEALRDGGERAPDAIRTINERCRIGFPDGVDAAALEGRVTLTTRVNDAEQRNGYQLRALEDEPRRYTGETEGDLPPTRERLPAPMQLDLAIGAQVLFTRNDPGHRWVNGTLGRVVDVGETTAEVEILWGPETGAIHEVKPVTWESTAFEWNPGAGRTIGMLQRYTLVLRAEAGMNLPQ